MRLRGKKGIRESLEQQQNQGTVILNPKLYKGKWAQLFGNDQPIHVELGMGKGRFISEMSYRHPDINYIGIDRYDELILRASGKVRGLYETAEYAGEEGYLGYADIGTDEAANMETKGASVSVSLDTQQSSLEADKPGNLALVLFNIEYIDEMFADGEIERIYLHFSDPWPKKRHARRRLTHPRFLEKYVRLLNANGEIHLKTDSADLFEFSLNSFSNLGLRMSQISLDYYREGVRPGQIMTEYEQKFVEQGMNIYRCEVIVGNEALARLQRVKGNEMLEVHI